MWLQNWPSWQAAKPYWKALECPEGPNHNLRNMGNMNLENNQISAYLKSKPLVKRCQFVIKVILLQSTHPWLDPPIRCSEKPILDLTSINQQMLAPQEPTLTTLRLASLADDNEVAPWLMEHMSSTPSLGGRNRKAQYMQSNAGLTPFDLVENYLAW